MIKRRGYLFLPGLLAGAELDALVADLHRCLVEQGWPVDDRSFRLRDDHDGGPALTRESYHDIYGALQATESVHRLAWSEALLGIVRAVLGPDVFCHPTKAVRVGLPTDGYVTKPHQDLSRLVVTADVLTAWVCLTDCRDPVHGVQILEGSHRSGFLVPDDPEYRSANIYLRISPDDPRWLTADFTRGDVVVFHSRTVHAGGANRSSSIRMSADFRYQRTDDPVLVEWLRPHGYPRVHGWDRLTAGWASRRWVTVPPTVRVVDDPGAARGAPCSRSPLLDAR